MGGVFVTERRWVGFVVSVPFRAIGEIKLIIPGVHFVTWFDEIMRVVVSTLMSLRSHS